MKKSSTKLIGVCYTLVMLFFFSTTNVNAQYCTSASTSPADDHITNITLSGIENTTGSGTYTDYTDMTAYVVPGVSYPISATMGNANSYTETLTVFIDWNQDGDFLDDGERYEIGTCTGTGCSAPGLSGWIEVPFSAMPGDTRMRAIGNYNSYASTACGTYTYGETEDYTINVSVGECTPPNFEYVITNNCEDETYSVSAILNDFGTNSFVSVAMTRSDGVPAYPVSLTDDLPQGYEFLFISDVPTGVTVTAVIQAINPSCNLNQTWLSLGCYCIPTMTYGCEYDNTISNVTLEGETVTLNNTTTCSTNAYGYFADLAQPDLAPGELYTLDVSTGYYSNMFMQAIAWIDFNKDSEFQEDEMIGNTNGGGMDNANFSFVVPEALPAGSYRLRVKMVYGSTAPTWDACATGGNGETEDYKITILELDDCAGTPTAGTATSDDETYCALSPIELSTTGASSPANGLTRIWQSSPAGMDTWTDIEGATSTTFVVTEGIAVATDFRYKVTCTISEQTDITDFIAIGLKAANECYCAPLYTYNCDGGDRITNVSLEGETVNLNNTTTCSASGYGDFTNLTNPDLSPGNTYTISVTTDVWTPSNIKVIAWIDFNQNGVFELSEQVANSGANGLGTGTKTFTFSLPDVLATGAYRLRVRGVYDYQAISPTFTACNLQNYGETEDYMVQILGLDDCAGTPSAGTPDESAFEICTLNPFTVSVSGASDAANGLTRVWQSSPAGQDVWTDIAQASAPTLLIANGVNVATDYRYTTDCTLSGEGDVSATIQVAMSPATDCYCTPTYSSGCEYGERISNVALVGENTSIDNTSECGVASYSNFTTLPAADLAPGASYTLTVTTDYSWPTSDKVIAWIDFNANGFFEANEQIANSNTTGFPSDGVLSFSFTVADDIAPGDYRMRVRMAYDWQTAPPVFTACSSEGSGETEDYMVTIIDLDACEGTPTAGTPNEAAFTVCALNPFNVIVNDPSDAANGLLRIWQSSPAGANEWTDIEGAFSKNFLITAGIETATDYRYYTMCDNSGESNISDIIEVGIKPGNECYCTPTYTTACSSGDRISNVTLIGETIALNNATQCSNNSYGDYTTGQPQPDLAPGESYTLSVSTDYSSPSDEEMIAWIDYNKNGHFDSDEKIATTTGSGLGTGTGTFEFTVPDGLDAGEYRMRVRLVYDWQETAPTFDQCDNQNYGETEDYTVTIIDMDVCQGTPAAGTPDNPEFDVCPTIAFLLSVSDASDPADGLTRIWQSSPAGENEWTDIAGAFARNYSHPGISAPTDFRYTMTCSFSEEGDISDVIQVGIKPADQCYCVPTNNMNENYFISSVSTEGALQNLYNVSGFTAGGYADYSDSDTLIVNNSQVITFSMSFQQYNHFVRVWVDLNQDGTFETSELVITSGSQYMESPYSGSFTIPETMAAGSYRIRVKTTNYWETPVQPCGNDNYSEVEDYILKVIDSEECAGTPSAGTASNTEVLVCAENNFSISVAGASNPIDGIVRIWQSSPAGQEEWTDIVGAISTTYPVVGGISEATDYRYVVTCTNSNETDISNVIQVTLKPGTECYCTPVYTTACSSGDLISNVSLNGESVNIDNTTTCSTGNYGDYTDLPAPDLAPGATYSLSVSTTYSSPVDEDVIAWIDYNGNGAFDAGEQIASTNGTGLNGGIGTFSFTLPGDLASGMYRLRVRLVYAYGSDPLTFTACSTESYGETEDYMIEVLELDGCSGTPTAGTASYDGTSVCGSVPFTLTATGSSEPADGLVKRWQISPAGQNSWTDIPGISASSPTYTLSAGIVEASDFRYRATCTNSDETDYSNVIELTLNPANECYCIPVGTNASYYTNDFSTTGGIENITNNGTGFSVGGYGVFTDMVVKQVKTESITFTAVPNSNSTYGFRVWVDWNQDGTFDTTEEVVFASTGYAYSHTGTITVPESALTGVTRMRTVTHYLNGQAAISPCAINHTYGEFEDYAFEVVALDLCEGTPEAGDVDATGYDVCALTPIVLNTVGASEAADGLTRGWQSSPAGQDVWTYIPGAASPSYTYTTGISEMTDFRYRVECEYSEESAVSAVLTLGLNPANECYCIPVGTNSTYYISNFATTGGTSQNITNSASGFSTGGYGDFTSMEVTQSPGGVVNFTADVQGGTAGFRIWVDWNHDGQFSVTEEVAYNSTTYSSTFSGSFTVPAGTEYGATRMRIVSHWSNATGLIDPCATNHTYGEFEDYTFNISEPVWDCPELEANIGGPCNDGNPETANDTVTADCGCEGTIPPVGTFCESAITVDCNAPVASYNSATSIATNTTACTMGAQGLWFKFEGTGMDITITSTATFNHEMSVNSGSCDDLTSVACVDGGVGAETYIIEESVEGQMYYVYVANWSASTPTTGTIGIKIECEEAQFDCPELEANIGDVCDDNNANTDNDVITADCGCAGTPILLEDQCGYENLDNMNYDVNGSAYQDASFVGNNGVTWTYVAARDNNGDANGSGIAGNAIMLRRLSSDSKITSSTVPGGISDFSVTMYKGFTGAGDRQVELFVNGVSYGTSVAFDDFDAHVFTVTGIDVAGDVVIEIRNVTERQIIIDDITWTCGPVVTYDCPDLQVNFGDACDDGNAMTENDMYNTDCECVGTAISEFDCPDLGANVGDTCNDGNPLTENDVVTEACECAGTLIEFDCPDLNVNFGDACDDGNDNTENDMYNTDCECVGTAIIYDCPELFANVGDACSDDTIENGVVNDNCECVQWVFTPTVDKFTFTMYPNPAGSNESVTLTSNQSIDRYEILDITGKLIDAQIILNQNEIVIGLRNYSAGMYILKAYSGSNFSTQKMVVR